MSTDFPSLLQNEKNIQLHCYIELKHTAILRPPTMQRRSEARCMLSLPSLITVSIVNGTNTGTW